LQLEILVHERARHFESNFSHQIPDYRHPRLAARKQGSAPFQAQVGDRCPWLLSLTYLLQNMGVAREIGPLMSTDMTHDVVGGSRTSCPPQGCPPPGGEMDRQTLTLQQIMDTQPVLLRTIAAFISQRICTNSKTMCSLPETIGFNCPGVTADCVRPRIVSAPVSWGIWHPRFMAPPC